MLTSGRRRRHWPISSGQLIAAANLLGSILFLGLILLGSILFMGLIAALVYGLLERFFSGVG